MSRRGPTFALVCAVACALLTLVCATGCRDSEDASGEGGISIAEETVTAVGAGADASADSTAVLALGVEAIDFGRIAQDEVVESRVIVTNVGDGDLVISRVSSN